MKIKVYWFIISISIISGGLMPTSRSRWADEHIEIERTLATNRKIGELEYTVVAKNATPNTRYPSSNNFYMKFFAKEKDPESIRKKCKTFHVLLTLFDVVSYSADSERGGNEIYGEKITYSEFVSALDELASLQGDESLPKHLWRTFAKQRLIDLYNFLFNRKVLTYNEHYKFRPATSNHETKLRIKYFLDKLQALYKSKPDELNGLDGNFNNIMIELIKDYETYQAEQVALSAVRQLQFKPSMTHTQIIGIAQVNISGWKYDIVYAVFRSPKNPHSNHVIRFYRPDTKTDLTRSAMFDLFNLTPLSGFQSMFESSHEYFANKIIEIIHKCRQNPCALNAFLPSFASNEHFIKCCEYLIGPKTAPILISTNHYLTKTAILIFLEVVRRNRKHINSMPPKRTRELLKAWNLERKKYTDEVLQFAPEINSIISALM